MKLLALIAVMLACHGGAAAQPWKPDRVTAIIVAAGPGGGNDIAARVIQRILQDNRLMAMPVNVVNKPGGGGAIAYNYLNQHAGDGHFLAMSSPTLHTNHILGTSPLSYRDFTTVAQLADENLAFVVRSDSPIKTGHDLIKMLRKDPESVKFAFGTSRGNGNHIAIGLVAQAAGVDPRKITAVVFKATSEAVVALLGGHVDVVPSTGATVLAALKAGQMRALAVTSEKRMQQVFADVPTWKELGVNAVISSNRSLIGPRGMTPAQLAYWDNVLGKLTSTDDWKVTLDKNLWTASYLPSEQARQDFAAQYGQMKEMLAALGLVK